MHPEPAERGLLERQGAWFALGGDRIGQGRERAAAWLRANPAALQGLLARLAAREAELAAGGGVEAASA